MTVLRWTPEQVEAHQARIRKDDGNRAGSITQKPKKPHKYRAEPVVVDGIRFDSKLEGAYYEHLKLRMAADNDPLQYFLRQVPLHLPGGVTLRVDFQIFILKDTFRHLILYHDTKGVETESFKAKRKIAEAIYPIKIEVIKRGGF